MYAMPWHLWPLFYRDLVEPWFSQGRFLLACCIGLQDIMFDQRISVENEEGGISLPYSKTIFVMVGLGGGVGWNTCFSSRACEALNFGNPKA